MAASCRNQRVDGVNGCGGQLAEGVLYRKACGDAGLQQDAGVRGKVTNDQWLHWDGRGSGGSGRRPYCGAAVLPLTGLLTAAGS